MRVSRLGIEMWDGVEPVRWQLPYKTPELNWVAVGEISVLFSKYSQRGKDFELPTDDRRDASFFFF